MTDTPHTVEELSDRLRDIAHAMNDELLPHKAFTLFKAADRIEAQAKEIARLHYFLRVIDEAANGIRSETAIALRPQHLTAEDGTS
jgi:hypothetical protein